MHTSSTTSSESAILSRVLQPEKPSFSAAVARAILTFDFNAEDKQRMQQLSGKAQEGTLTGREQAELDNFERVGDLINLLQSKARRAHDGERSGNQPR